MLQPKLIDLEEVDGNGRDTSIAVADQATVYTVSQDVGYAEFFGLWVKAASATGTPDLKVEIEMGPARPGTEGAADTDWAVPDGLSDVYTNLTAETAKIKSISPIPMRYMRLKITGNVGNTSDALLEAKVFTQEHR